MEKDLCVRCRALLKLAYTDIPAAGMTEARDIFFRDISAMLTDYPTLPAWSTSSRPETSSVDQAQELRMVQADIVDENADRPGVKRSLRQVTVE